MSIKLGHFTLTALVTLAALGLASTGTQHLEGVQHDDLAAQAG
jgi:hypothetical protein